VVLAQWTLPTQNPTLPEIDLPPKDAPPFLIVPPIGLRLALNFGLDVGLTLGYDSYGFTPAFQQDPTNTNNGDVGHDLAEGLFLSEVHLALTGSVTLNAEADLGIVRIGGGGTIGLTFGVGANDKGLNFGVNDDGGDTDHDGD